MKLDTPQTLDPLGGLTARMVVVVACILALGVATLSTVHGRAEIVSPPAAAVSLAALVGAVIVLLRASSPFHAPFGLRAHLLIVSLLAVSAIAETVASFGRSTLILDGYSYLTLAVFLFPLGSYRPAVDVLATGAGLSSLLAVLAVMQTPYLVTPFPAAVFALLTAAPALATGVGAAALSRHLVRALHQWQAEGIVADRVAAHAWIEPLDLIDDEVLPLLERVTAARSVSASDSDEAGRVGSALRRLLVEESDAEVLPQWGGRIIDPGGVLSTWSMRQRTSIQALAEKIDATGPTSEASLTLGREQDDWILEAVWTTGRAPARGELAPFLATVGVAFDGVRFRRSDSRLTVCGRGSRST